MLIPGSISLADLPPPPLEARRTLRRWLGQDGRESSIRVVRSVEPELYRPQVVMEAADLGGLVGADHFLNNDGYLSRRFLVAEGRQIAVTRHGKAVAAPGRGLIDEFNVGGGAAIPRDLLAGDLAETADGWSVGRGDVEQVEGVCAPFCHYGLGTFGHFVLDGLLQVFLFRRELASGSVRLAHWPLPHAWMGPVLEQCGVSARARRELRRPVALLRRAALSSALAGHGVYFPNALSVAFFAWLRSVFVGERPASGGRLYIRRSDQFGRAITNAGELEGLATARGFQVITPEALPAAEQIRLFAGAEVVLSAWGSGLTLAPLLGGGRRVIELLPTSVTDPWFMRQAVVHGLRYSPIVHPSDSGGGFRADLERVDRVLAGLPSGS